MKKNLPAPTLHRILSTDRSIGLALSVVLVVLGLGLLVWWQGEIPTKKGRVKLQPEEIRNVLLLTFSLASIFTAAAVHRILAIRAIFVRGVRTVAEVLQVLAFKSGAQRVKLAFTLDGAEIRTSTDVKREVGIDASYVGNEIEIITDPKHPKRAFLYDAFVSNSGSDTEFEY